VGIVQVQANLLGLHGPRLEKKNAGDNLKAIGDAMLHLLQQNFLLSKQRNDRGTQVVALRYLPCDWQSKDGAQGCGTRE